MRELINGKQKSRENGKEMTDKTKMNIICDKLAGATTRATLEGGDAQGRVLSDLPYAGLQAMLKIRNKGITSRYADELYKARQTGPMQEYCKQKYNWIDEIFDSIHCESVGSVRWKFSPTMRTQTCKIMHDWLPTGHMREWTKEGTQCSGCEETNEKLRHVWQCPTPRMTEKEKTVIASVKRMKRRRRYPNTHMLEALCHVIQCEMDGEGNPVKKTHDTLLKTAIQAQQMIGFDMMMRGFLAKDWMEALMRQGVPSPEQ